MVSADCVGETLHQEEEITLLQVRNAIFILSLFLVFRFSALFRNLEKYQLSGNYDPLITQPNKSQVALCVCSSIVVVLDGKKKVLRQKVN